MICDGRFQKFRNIMSVICLLIIGNLNRKWEKIIEHISRFMEHYLFSTFSLIFLAVKFIILIRLVILEKISVMMFFYLNPIYW